MLADAWQADRHTVWDITWPAAPIGGPLTVEVWRKENRYRFEILEAAAPALIGQTLVFDGRHAWRYNRLEPPQQLTPVAPALSPVTDAFAIINRLIASPPQTATQEAVHINYNATQKITATFGPNSELSLWKDDKTGLPLRITFSVDGQQATLKARRAEPLPNPPPELFTPGPWIHNLR